MPEPRERYTGAPPLSGAAPVLTGLARQLDAIGFDGLQRLLRGPIHLLQPFVLAGARSGYLRALGRLDPPLQALLRWTTLGESVPRGDLLGLLSEDVLDGLVDLGLVEVVGQGELSCDPYRLVSFRGLYFWVHGYRSTMDPSDFAVYLGPDSYQLAHALPGRPGPRVLDVCCGGGFQALCAAQRRGVDRVVGLDINEAALLAGRRNALMNGLDELVEFRLSDGLEALAPGEQFELILCNPPFVPVPEGYRLPLSGDGGPRGLDFIDRLLVELPDRLAPGGRFLMVLDAYGDAEGPWVRESIERLLVGAHGGIRADLYLPQRDGLDASALATIAMTIQLFAGAPGRGDEAVAAALVDHFRELGGTHVYRGALLAVQRGERDDSPSRLAVHGTYNPWSGASKPRWAYLPRAVEARAHQLTLLDGGMFVVLPDRAPVFSSFDGRHTLAELVQRTHGQEGQVTDEVIQAYVRDCYHLELRGALYDDARPEEKTE